jgi:hypothetical protein
VGTASAKDAQVFLPRTVPGHRARLRSTNDIEHVDATAKLMSLVDKELLC